MLTSGNMMLMLPVDARPQDRPQLRAEQVADSCSASRMLRSPRNGLRSSSGSGTLGSLSAPRSIVRITTGLPCIASATSRVGRVLLLLGRLVVAAQEQELGAVEPDAVGAALLALLDFVGKLDVAQQLNPHAVGRLGRQVAELFELRRERPLLHRPRADSGRASPRPGAGSPGPGRRR